MDDSLPVTKQTETQVQTSEPFFTISLEHDFTFSLKLSLTLIIIVVLAVVVINRLKRLFVGYTGSKFEIDTAELGLGSSKISFKPNREDQQIAYKIWVELSTRKIGLPIDLENDVVAEVYDSWHNFFSITRELIKDIPVGKVKNVSTRKIITLSISVLNEGLRPHLTKWQARFRKWYDHQLQKSGEDVDPQGLQAKYPNFDDLKSDLEKVNRHLILYREKMRELVLGLPDQKDNPVDVEKPKL